MNTSEQPKWRPHQYDFPSGGWSVPARSLDRSRISAGIGIGQGYRRHARLDIAKIAV
jgi:hypothetical protein